MVKGWFFSLVLVLVLAGAGAGCSSPKPAPQGTASASGGAGAVGDDQKLSEAAKSASGTGPVKKLWMRKLDGLITDLNLSENGRAILVATAPDRENGIGGREHWLYRFDLEGHQKWKRKLKSRVKAQTISHDGSLAVYSTYDDQLTAIDSTGKEVWKLEGVCKPILLGKVRRMICYHDDDAEPEIAFDVYDWKGNKVFSYPIAFDVLSLKVSRDERNLAIGLSKGQVVLFDPAFQPVWQKKVDGEVIDVSASSGSDPKVAILSTLQGSRHVTVLDSKGNRVSDAGVRDHVEQIEIAPDASAVLLYGNSVSGQVISLLSGPELEQKWRRVDPRPADFSSPMIVARDFVIMGHEDMAPGIRQSRLLAFDFDGKVRWSLPLVTEEGAYLYSHSFSEDAAGLAVGTDDGNVSAFRFAKGNR